jgi:hypothetical protein
LARDPSYFSDFSENGALRAHREVRRLHAGSLRGKMGKLGLAVEIKTFWSQNVPTKRVACLSIGGLAQTL